MFLQIVKPHASHLHLYSLQAKSLLKILPPKLPLNYFFIIKKSCSNNFLKRLTQPLNNETHTLIHKPQIFYYLQQDNFEIKFKFFCTIIIFHDLLKNFLDNHDIILLSFIPFFNTNIQLY